MKFFRVGLAWSGTVAGQPVSIIAGTNGSGSADGSNLLWISVANHAWTAYGQSTSMSLTAGKFTLNLEQLVAHVEGNRDGWLFQPHLHTRRYALPELNYLSRSTRYSVESLSIGCARLLRGRNTRVLCRHLDKADNSFNSTVEAAQACHVSRLSRGSAAGVRAFRASDGQASRGLD